MIKRLFLIFAFICMAAGGAYGAASVESTVEFTGREWVRWDEAKKDSFINGFIAGSNHVIWRNLKQAPAVDRTGANRVLAKYLGGAVDETTALPREEAALLKDAAVERTINSTNKTLMKYVVYNASGGRLLKGLNRFYSDEKNRGINLTDAIYIVNKSLRGAPAEEVGRLIEEQRRSKRQTIFVFGNRATTMSVR